MLISDPPAIVSQQNIASSSAIQALQKADNAADDGHTLQASAAYTAIARRYNCAGRDSQSTIVGSYLVARFLSVAPLQSSASFSNAMKNCRVARGDATPFADPIDAFVAKRSRSLFPAFGRAYSSVIHSDVPSKVNSKDDFTSRIGAGLAAAGSGDDRRARAFFASAMKRAASGAQISDCYLFLAQVDLIDGNTRSAKLNLARAISPRQAYTSYPALTIGEFAAAYELQSLLM